MAFFKSKKDTVDKAFDPDADLDSFDVPDFDLPGADSTGKREPVTEFRTGAISGFKSSLTDTERLRKLTRDTLPSGFGQSMDLYNQFSSQAGRLYDDVHKEMAPVIKDSKRLASRMIKDDTKFVPKWLKEKAAEWREEGKSARTASQQELRDNLMNSELGMIFAEQSAQDSRQRQEDQLQDHATRIKQDQQHNESIAQLDGIRQAVDRSDRFTRDVTLRVQKKGLELQYRSLFVAQDMLAKLDETLQVMRPGLETISKNTGLPDFVKISQGEDFKRVFRGRTFEALHSGLFGSNSSYMNKMFGTLRNNVKGQVSDFVNSLQMGLMQVEMGADMAESMDGMVTKEQMAGQMAGGWAGGAVGEKLAKWLRKNFVDGNKTIENMDLKLRGFNENLTRNFNEFATDGSAEFEGGMKGFLWKLAQWMKPSLGVDTGIVTGSVKNLNEPYAWTRRTDRTINEVMPQLTARMLRELVMLRTGEDTAPLLVYDFNKGVFSSEKEMARTLRKKVLDSGAITGTTDNLDVMIKEIDPKGVLSQKQKEAMREMLFNNSTRHRTITSDGIRKSGFVSDEYAAEADTVRTILEQHLKGLDAEQLLQFQHKHNRIANNAGDPRQQIQDYVDAGYEQHLLKAGVLRYRAAAQGDVLNLADKDKKLGALNEIIDDLSNGVASEDRSLFRKLHTELKKAKPKADDLIRSLTSKGYRQLLLSASIIKPKEGGGLEFDMDRYRQRIVKGGLEDTLYGDEEQLGTTQKFGSRKSAADSDYDTPEMIDILLQVHEAMQQQAQAFKALSDRPVMPETTAATASRPVKMTVRDRLRANRQKSKRRPNSANLDIEPPEDIGDAYDETPLGDVTMRVSNFADIRPHLDESLYAHLGQWWELEKQGLGILFDELRKASEASSTAQVTPASPVSDKKASLRDRLSRTARGGLNKALSFLKAGKQNDPAAEDGHETNIASVVDGMTTYEQVSLSLMRRIARNTAVMRETGKSQLMFSLGMSDVDFARMGPWMKSLKDMKIPGMGIFTQEKFNQFFKKSKLAAQHAKDVTEKAAKGEKQELLKFDGTMAGTMAALGQRVGLAASWTTDKLWAGAKYAKDKADQGLNAGKAWWNDDIYDIYLQGEDKPVMLAKDIREGKYFDAHTGLPITNLSSITPAGVKDGSGSFVFPPGSELYAWDPKTRTMRALTTTKAQIKKAFDHSITFAKKWGPRAFDAAQRVARGWIEGAAEIASATFGVTKRGLKVLVDPPIDIYVVGDMSAPKLLGVVMSSGGYFSATTGKVIEVPGDIDGPIKDADKQLRLTTEDLVKGLCDVDGNPIVPTWSRVTQMVGTTISKARDFGRTLIEKGRELLTRGLTGIRQVFGNWSVEFSARKQVGVLQQIRDFMFVKFGEGIDLEQFSDAKYNITDTTNLNVSKGIEAIKDKYEALANKVESAKQTYRKWRTGEGIEAGSLSDKVRKTAIGGWAGLKQNLSELEEGGVQGWLAAKKEQGKGALASAKDRLMGLKDKGLKKAMTGVGKAERAKNFFKNLFSGGGKRFGMTPGPAKVSMGGTLAVFQRQGFTFGQNDRSTAYTGNTAYGNQARLGHDRTATRAVGQKYLDLSEMTPPQLLSYASHLRDMIMEMRDHPDPSVQLQVSRWMQEAERVAKYVKLQQNQRAARGKYAGFQRQLGYNGKATSASPKDQIEDAKAIAKTPLSLRDRVMQASRSMLTSFGRKFKAGWARVRPSMTSEQATEINTQNTATGLAGLVDYFRNKDKKTAGDHDGDGERDGSWRSRLKAMQEARKNKAAQNKEKKEAGKKADQDNGGWLKSLGVIGSIIGGIATMFSPLARLATTAFGLVRGAGLLGFGAGKVATQVGGSVLGTTLKLGGRALWEVGKFTVMRAIPGLLIGGATTLSAGLGLAGGVLAGALSLAAGLIASPVGLAALAAVGVGLAGAGIFKGVKWLMRNRMTPLQAIRYTQYGFHREDNQHWAKIEQTEDMLSPLVKVMADKPELDESKIDLSKLMQIWDLDAANEEHVKLFFSWYGDRFRPMFLGHVTALNAMTGSKLLAKADELEGQKLKAYFQATRFQNGPYGVQYLPLLKQTRQASGPEDVRKTIEWAYNKLEIAKIKAGSDKIVQETTQITGAAGAAVADAVSKTTGSTPVGPFGDNQEAKSSKPAAFGFNLSIDGKDVLNSGGGQLKALEAVRFKTYGLIELKTDQVISLRRLEVVVLPQLTAAGSKVQFNGSPTEVMEAVCGLFGFSRASVLDTKTWKAWFEDRFLPTYLTYIGGYYAITGRLDAAQGAQLLSGKDALTIAMAMVSQSRVWTMSASPWPMSVLGQDSGVTAENIEFLKERAKNDKVMQERRDAQDRQLNVTAPVSANNTPQASAQRAKAFATYDAQGGGIGNPDAEAAPNVSGATPAKAPVGTGPIAMAEGGLNTAPATTGTFSLNKPGVTLDGLHPVFKVLLYGALQEYYEKTGKKAIITSGFRTYAQQEAEYKANPKKAAPPGGSIHEFGLAVDINTPDLNAMDKLGILKKYGLTRPIGGEPWHLEPAGIQTDIGLARRSHSDAARLIRSGVGRGGGGLGTMAGTTLKTRDRTNAMAALNAAGAPPSAEAVQQAMKKAGQSIAVKPPADMQQTPAVGQMTQTKSEPKYAPRAETERRQTASTAPVEQGVPGYKKPETFNEPKAPLAQSVAKQTAPAPAPRKEASPDAEVAPKITATAVAKAKERGQDSSVIADRTIRDVARYAELQYQELVKISQGVDQLVAFAQGQMQAPKEVKPAPVAPRNQPAQGTNVPRAAVSMKSAFSD